MCDHASICMCIESGHEACCGANRHEFEAADRVPAPLGVERLTDLLRRAKPHLYAVDRKSWCWCDITVPGAPHDPDCKWVADVEEVGALRVEIDDLLSNHPSTDPAYSDPGTFVANDDGTVTWSPTEPEFPTNPQASCFHMEAEAYNEGSEYGHCPTCGQQDIYIAFVD